MKLLLWVPLAIAVLSTLRLQATWSQNDILGALLWQILLASWVCRLFLALYQRQKLKRQMIVLPLCALFLWICSLWNVPLHLNFWRCKPSLRQALIHPEIERDIMGSRQRVGQLYPLQLVHKDGATRVLLHTNSTFVVLGDEKGGFAYFPKGLDDRKFKNFYLHHEHSEYLPLENGWFAVRLSGDDF